MKNKYEEYYTTYAIREAIAIRYAVAIMYTITVKKRSIRSVYTTTRDRDKEAITIRYACITPRARDEDRKSH